MTITEFLDHALDRYTDDVETGYLGPDLDDHRTREIAAARATIAHHAKTPSTTHPGFDCMWCRMHWPCFDIRNAASVFSTDPDYRQEWKP